MTAFLVIAAALAQTVPFKTQVVVDGHGTGFMPSPPSAYRAAFKLNATRMGDGERPSQIVLTQFLPPIGNQGNQGSCVGWSTAYNCFTYGVARNQKLGSDALKEPKWEFSPAFVYHLGNKGQNKGMQINEAMKIIVEKGCASLAEMPYDDSDYLTPPPPEALTRAARFKAEPNEIVCLAHGKEQPPNIEGMKTFLATMKRPFVIGAMLPTDWPQRKVEPDFVYNPDPSNEKVLGGHAMAVVGYDDAKHAFRICNSWGPNWGDHGFIWVSEDFIKNKTIESWGFIPGGVVARGGKGRINKYITVTPPSK